MRDRQFVIVLKLEAQWRMEEEKIIPFLGG
jgi:hypothetical protein